jgi:hypothetical protein
MSTFEEYIDAHYTRNTINLVKAYICDRPANAYARNFDDYFYMVTDDFDPRMYGDHENELDTYEKRYAYINRPVDYTQGIRRTGSRVVQLHYLYCVAMFEELLRNINSAMIIQFHFRKYFRAKRTAISHVVHLLDSVINEREIIKRIIKCN